MFDYTAIGQEAQKIIIDHLKILLPPIGAVTAFVQAFKITLRGEGVKTHWCIWVVLPFFASALWIGWQAFPPMTAKGIFHAMAMTLFLGSANILVYFIPPIRKFLNGIEQKYIEARAKARAKRKK